MKENTCNEVIELYYGGASRRRISEILRISRNTVRKIIAQHQRARERGPSSPSELTPKKRRASKLDEHEGFISEKLARYPDLTAVRLLEELRKAGFQGHYSIVRDYLRRVRPVASKEPVIRFETGPAEQAQMDYSPYTINFTGERRRRVHAFSYILGYSRRQYIRFVEYQDFSTTVREHIRAFDYLGGAAAKCLYDNMKVVVLRWECDEPIYNPQFLAFATHYGFRPVACRPRRPQTKGKVERPFDYIEKNFLNGRDFHSLRHMNEAAHSWLAEVADVRDHRTTGRRPIDLHAIEAASLIPVPAHHYEHAEVVYRFVHPEAVIHYRQNAYEVPDQIIGRHVPVRITEEALIVYGPNLLEVASHELFPRTTRGETRLLACKERRRNRRNADDLRHAFESWGTIPVQFFDGLVRRRRYALKEASRVLALVENWRKDDVLDAIERALRFHAFSAGTIESILAVQASPRPFGDLFESTQSHPLSEILNTPEIVPRDPQDYQDLLADSDSGDQCTAPDEFDHEEPDARSSDC